MCLTVHAAYSLSPGNDNSYSMQNKCQMCVTLYVCLPELIMCVALGVGVLVT